MPIIPDDSTSGTVTPSAAPVSSGGAAAMLPTATTAPTVTYRRLDANNEPQFGQGKADFVTDIDAVAQAIRTRLRLFLSEWWEDQNDGTPYWQKILGVAGAGRNPQAINLILTERIMATPYVTGVRSVQGQFNATTRAYQFYCVVDTAFGAVVVTNIPSSAVAQSQGYGEGGYGLGLYPQ